MSLLAWIALLTVWSLFQPLPAGENADVLAPYRLKEWEGDGRLARRVSLSVWGSPLAEALRQVSQRSGVSLRVSREAAQWRAVIHVQETPLSELLAGIAFTFDLAWRRLPVKEGDPPRLRALPDARAAEGAAGVPSSTGGSGAADCRRGVEACRVDGNARRPSTYSDQEGASA